MRHSEVCRLAQQVGTLLQTLEPLPTGCCITFVVHDQLSGAATVGSPRGLCKTLAVLRAVIQNLETTGWSRPKGPPS